MLFRTAVPNTKGFLYVIWETLPDSGDFTGTTEALFDVGTTGIKSDPIG